MYLIIIVGIDIIVMFIIEMKYERGYILMQAKGLKKVMCFVLAGAMVFTSLYISDDTSAAKKASLKTKKISVKEGKSKTITIKNRNKKMSYTFKSSKKSVAKVSKKGKVTGVKAGKAQITVKESYKVNKKTKSRKLGVCKVTVSGNNVVVTGTPSVPTTVPAQATSTSKAAATAVVIPTSAPTSKPFIGPTAAPTEVASPAPTRQPAYGTLSYDFNDGNAELFEGSNSAEGDGSKCILADGTCSVKLGKTMVYGGICNVSVKVKQDSGSEKDLTVGYDGEYLNFKQDGAYISTKSVDPMSGTNVNACPSGEWKQIDVSFELPKYSYDFNLSFTMKDNTKFLMDDVSIETMPYEGCEYAKMVENSTYSSGNNARIKKAIEKARAGEDVTLAYLGGSITEGFAASETNNADCYAETSYNEFKEAFGPGDGSNIHFINAGMSGTSSELGIIRYQRDVLDQMKFGKIPDILFIDYAVNDGDSSAETYESVIRTALEQGSAVVLMFVLYSRGNGRENAYRDYGKLYDIAMVSPAQGMASTNKTKFDDWFYWSDGHPDVGGHRYQADCIMNLFKTIDNEAEEEDNITDINSITPKKGKAFVGMKTLNSETDIEKCPSVKSVDAGSFNQKDTSQVTLQYIKNGQEKMLWFPEAWAHTASSGTDSFKATITCNSILVGYKQAKSGFGVAECYVDGKLTATMSNVNGGWNNASIAVALSSSEVKEHELEIKMKAGDENKPFTIFSIGYANINEFEDSLVKSSFVEAKDTALNAVDMFFEEDKKNIVE